MGKWPVSQASKWSVFTKMPRRYHTVRRQKGSGDVDNSIRNGDRGGEGKESGTQ